MGQPKLRSSFRQQASAIGLLLSGALIACGSGHSSDKTPGDQPLAGQAGAPDDRQPPDTGEGGAGSDTMKGGGGAPDTAETPLPVIPGDAGDLAAALVAAPDNDTAVALTNQVLA